MNKILIFSIKPQHAENIFKGKKTVELRRIKPKEIVKGSVVLVYVSSPVKALIGYFIVDNVIKESLSELWNLTKNKANVTEYEFNEYFKNKSDGTAIYIKKRYQYEFPIPLENIKKKIKNFVPPQSFYYLDSNDVIVSEFHKILH